MTYPDLPVLGELIMDDPWWSYRTTGLGGGSGVTRLRVWKAREGGEPLVAVATELGVGVSVTNSIEFITAKLTTVYRGQPLVLLEHWPETESSGNEHLDQVVTLPGSGLRWRRVWPTPTSNPQHEQLDEWIRRHGQQILAPAEPGGIR